MSARELSVRAGLAASGVLGFATVAGAGDPNNLMFPLTEGTWTLVDFFGDGPTGSGPATGPDQANDDDSASVPAFGFNFNLYGTNHGGGYVNNNGNISFGAPFSTFTSTGFPVNGFPMVAPFWADVDTGNVNNQIGHVWQRLYDSNGDSFNDTFVVTWDNVGWYNEQGTERNTFQVAISTGQNPRMGNNTVCFSYDDMQWTTGQASGGGPFGGTAATVGANAGDNVNFFQIGRFDQAGNAYDGPGGLNDGVDFLDGIDICFSPSQLNNQAPFAVGLPAGNKYFVDVFGPDLNSFFNVIGPELLDGVTITGVVDFNGAQADGLLLGTANGDPATVSLFWDPAAALNGNMYDIRIDFEDSFGATGSQFLQICIVPAPGSAALLALASIGALRRRRA